MFLHPSGSHRCEGGNRGKGKREGEEARGGKGRREARPPCSHGRAECLHCRGSLCNTSGILRPLSLQPGTGEWWEGGGQEGGKGGSGKERDLSGREKKRRTEEREREREREVEGESNSLHSLLWSVIRRALVFE